LLKKIESRRQTEIARLESAHAAQVEELRSKCRADAEERETRHAVRLNEIETEKTRAIERLAAEWEKELTGFRAFAAAELCRGAQARLSWDGPPAKDWRLPETFATEVPVGEVRVDLAELDLPCDPEGPFSLPGGTPVHLPARLVFPVNGGLYARAGTGKREDAMRMLFNAALRLFCSFPPAKTKMTIIDPVGLGQNFAALMHLADFDESLVGGRIWSDVTHIERELSELTEHMEIIIQKYLRNRFASLDEYNQEAGSMAEPYRFLLIADFPTGFSELAMEKLAGILASGSRCGVYALIHQDQRQKTPVILNEAHLKRNGLFFFEQDGDFILDEPVINNRGRFVPEEPPQPAVVDEILRAVGAQSRDAVRVEVPFEAAAPRPENVWSMTTDQVVRLPLGKSGAERLQYMELGRGTSQHALIAGKTGSGKSTLFHVIITNAALWYAPQELEVYLIDFKKGVEFKIYAEHQLPHARVVAIESDREFGLSVLRCIDKELTRRGELFRNARVQDLAAYRKSGAVEVLPRTLLMIDEFQEFFTEDDGISGDAALLLDRIVRQGRAFGVHVILGSQTLGGTYTLAKSTLGQMAVRIALQCNEADSYLILSDDNAAARLLSRPGEGIYNDMAGLIEGNNPFQVVWLSKEAQSNYLEMVRRKAQENPSGLEPTIVFEGNVPAELRNNKPLFTLAEQPAAEESSTCAWLGEANAIKGPTEVEFSSNSGSNLLIVGQRGEAALAMTGTLILSLAAGAPPDKARFYVLDGTAPEYGAQDFLTAMAAALPHSLEIIDQRRTAQALAELAAKVKVRQEGGDADQGRDYFIVLGLQKFRMLRQDDEFGFSSGDGEASPAQCLANLLNEGPGAGVHCLVWCDTLGNLNRSFGRKTVREFESRILFQMAAADSTELIDSPAANLLGLYNALLFTVQDGSVEKFRPYAMPDRQAVEKIGGMIRKKFEAKV
jgi:hypothetical protein